MPAGRPSDYSIELAEVICARLAAGEGLVRVCRDDGMPDLTSCYRWMRLHPEFLQMYARSKEECADTLADEIMEIADSDPGMNEMGIDRGGVDHLKLRVDARKWIAAKLKPKKYGDAHKVEHSGTVSLEQILGAVDKPHEPS